MTATTATTAHTSPLLDYHVRRAVLSLQLALSHLQFPVPIISIQNQSQYPITHINQQKSCARCIHDSSLQQREFLLCTFHICLSRLISMLGRECGPDTANNQLRKLLLSYAILTKTRTRDRPPSQAIHAQRRNVSQPLGLHCPSVCLYACGQSSRHSSHHS